MDKFVPRSKKGPEAIIQEKIVRKLKALGWFVNVTHGNVFQRGFPDIYSSHRMYGPRWIDVKVKDRYSFTNAQLELWPQMVANGSPIWILTSDEDHELEKLFRPCNLWVYLSKFT